MNATSKGAQSLLIDADDTLWENNVYFERAIGDFISFLNHREYSPEEVRKILYDVERECILAHGYGLHSFAHALTQTLERLAVEPITAALHQKIKRLTHSIADHPLEFLPQVPETLAYLAERHHLILVTKGAFAEQSAKVERSGVSRYFSAIDIVSEKDPATYHNLVEKYALSRDETWMIGNSPKSDINPALAAGLNAVFLPHGDTWILEHEDVACPKPSRQLLVLETFASLQEHF